MDKQKVIVWSSGSEHRRNHEVITLIDQLSKISPAVTFLPNRRGEIILQTVKQKNMESVLKFYIVIIVQCWGGKTKK